MKKLTLLTGLILIAALASGCETTNPQVLKGTYKKGVSTKNFQKALNASLANNNFSIVYSNDQGNVTTDWKGYTVVMVGPHRVKLIINFADGNLSIGPVIQKNYKNVFQSGAPDEWSTEYYIPDAETKTMVNKVVADLSDMLKTDVPYTWVENKPEA